MPDLLDDSSEDEEQVSPAPPGLEQPIRPRAHWCRPLQECVMEEHFVVAPGKRVPADAERHTRVFPEAQLRNLQFEKYLGCIQAHNGKGGEEISARIIKATGAFHKLATSGGAARCRSSCAPRRRGLWALDP